MNPVDYYAQGKWETRPKKLFQREKIALNLISPLSKENSSLLDVGCGEGIFLTQIAKKQQSLDLYGIDYSKLQIKKASDLPFKFKQYNLEKGIPFEEKRFDFVYAAEIIEHLYNPDFLLLEINRVLKDQGYLVLSTPNLCMWLNRILFPLGIQPLFVETSTKSKMIGGGLLKKFKRGESPVGHVRIFNKTAITDLLLANGFKIITIKGAVFDAGFPNWLLKIDNLFRISPSLSSHFVILARKVKTL